jgi:hypothetical protein
MRRFAPAVMLLLCCFSLCSSQSVSRAVTLSKLDNRLQALQYLDSGSPVLGKFHAMTSMIDKSTGMYRVIVYYSNLNDALQVGVQPNTVTHEFFTTSATLDQIAQLSMVGSVRYIALAKKYKPLLDKSVPEIHADKLQSGAFNGTSYTG